MSKLDLTLVAVLILVSVIATSAIWYVWAQTPTSTFWISPGVYPQASYTCWREGSNYFAKDATGQIDYSGTNASDVIGDALAGLTVGRTWQEKVVIMGDITVTAPILVPSNVDIEIFGKITLGNGVNKAIFRNLGWDSSVPYDPPNVNITIQGGVLDGNKANNPTDTPENGLIGFLHVLNVRIEGVHIIDTRSWAAIYLVGWGPAVGGTAHSKYWIQDCIIEGTVGASIYGYAIGISAYPTQKIIITGNQLFNNEGGIMFEDQGGDACIIDGNIIQDTTEGHAIWGGASKLIISNNFINQTGGSGIIASGTNVGNQSWSIVTGNYVEGATTDGIFVPRNYSVVSSNFVFDCDSDGIELENVWGTSSVTGNTVLNNTQHGILLDYCGNITVTGNTANWNGIYGIVTTNTANFNVIVGNVATVNGHASSDIVYAGANNKVAYNIGRYAPQGSA